MHIPDDPQFYEKFYFTPGDTGFKSFKTSKGNIGTLICWDQWFPEAARLTALKGAEIIFYPTAIGWHPKEKKKFGKSQLEAWLSVQRSHAIANGIYVAAINRVGIEKQGNKKIEFWGNSVVFDPSGNIVKKSGLKASKFLRPFNPVPQLLKNLKNIDKNLLSNKAITSAVAKQQKILGKKGRIMLRPSGTEDLIRIMVECTDINLVNESTEIITKAILEENENKKSK